MKKSLAKSVKYVLIPAGLLAAVIIGCNTKFMQTMTSDPGPVGGVFRGFQEAHQGSQLGDADEVELGKSVGILVTNRYPPVDNKRLVEYVNLIGYTLVSSSMKPDRQYTFGVLDTDDIGAYSGPAGYVMVTRGLIRECHDEAELAGAIAHELTHVIKQHGLQAARNAAEKAGYLDVAKSIIPADQANQFIDLGIDAVVRNGYDKPQEDEADQGAITLLISTGYDPHSYVHFLSHIAALQEAAPRPTSGPSDNGTWKQIMATHPNIPERVGAVAKEIQDAHASGGATLRDRFLDYTSSKSG